MKATVVTLDPQTLVPDEDIADAVGQAISGRLRIQWLNYTWDFDVTDIIDEDGRNARLAFQETETGERAVQIEYERPDGTTASLTPTAVSA